jgi:hypothetical protein
MVWNKKHHGAYHFFGHSHGTLKVVDYPKDHHVGSFKMGKDVGVDTNKEYRPYSFEELI